MKVWSPHHWAAREVPRRGFNSEPDLYQPVIGPLMALFA